MRRVIKEEYLQNPSRYELRTGKTEDAPDCPYGNKYEWLGYDLLSNEFVRFSKSLFVKLIKEQEEKSVK